MSEIYFISNTKWRKLNKAKLLLIYIIKQDIRIYMLPIAGKTAGPNGLNFFCGHSGVAKGCLRLKKKSNIFFQIFFIHGQRRALQLIVNKSLLNLRRLFFTLVLFRYLDTYEKYYFLGEDEDDDNSSFFDEEDSRTRRHRHQRIVTTVPATYNENQHRVSGLKTNKNKHNFYLKTCLSFILRTN